MLDGMALQALRTAGVRGIVQAGWSDLGIPDVLAEASEVLSIGEVPYEWLFPRLAAVVHHAGAGTTAAGLHAGVPDIPVPVRVDQPFWAGRTVALGVSPGAVPLR